MSDQQPQGTDPNAAPPNDPAAVAAAQIAAAHAAEQARSETPAPADGTVTLSAEEALKLRDLLDDNDKLRKDLANATLDRNLPTETTTPATVQAVHEVQPGDTLQSIADAYGVNVQVLVQANAKALSDEAQARGFGTVHVAPGPIQGDTGVPHPDSTGKLHVFPGSTVVVPAA